MSRILDAKLTLRHVLILGVIGLVLVVGGSAIAANPNALPAGSIRLTSATSDAPFNASGTDNPPVKAISADFNVPANHKADIQATFSATVIHNLGTYAYCFGKFSIDGATSDPLFHPGAGGFQLIGGTTSHEPDQFTATMTGWKTGIGPGYHHVNVYISSAYAGCQLEERTLNAVINIR